MKKVLFTLIAIIAFSYCAKAQSDTLIINLKNNQVDKVPISQIKNIKFENLTGISETQSAINNLQLGGNYPNPFGELTNIEFNIANPGAVEVVIYDNQGNQIQILKCENCQAGVNSLQWNCLDKNQNRSQSGIYYYEVRYGNEIQSKKMIVIK